jgi:hypothetical protein
LTMNVYGRTLKSREGKLTEHVGKSIGFNDNPLTSPQQKIPHKNTPVNSCVYVEGDAGVEPYLRAISQVSKTRIFLSQKVANPQQNAGLPKIRN